MDIVAWACQPREIYCQFVFRNDISFYIWHIAYYNTHVAIAPLLGRDCLLQVLRRLRTQWRCATRNYRASTMSRLHRQDCSRGASTSNLYWWHCAPQRFGSVSQLRCGGAAAVDAHEGVSVEELGVMPQLLRGGDAPLVRCSTVTKMCCWLAAEWIHGAPLCFCFGSAFWTKRLLKSLVDAHGIFPHGGVGSDAPTGLWE